jgi:hypothetical protein
LLLQKKRSPFGIGTNKITNAIACSFEFFAQLIFFLNLEDYAKYNRDEDFDCFNQKIKIIFIILLLVIIFIFLGTIVLPNKQRLIVF